MTNPSRDAFPHPGAVRDRYTSQPISVPGRAGGRHAVGAVAPSSRVVWPLLADDLFRLAHNDYGKPRLHLTVARTGLAAALLGELLHTGFVAVEQDKLLWRRTTVVPIDPLAAAVFAHVRAEPKNLLVRDWLTYLSAAEAPIGDIYDRVAERMERAGHVEQRTKGIFRRRTVWMPSDMNNAAWPWARLSQHLQRHEQLDDFDTALGGLVIATGLIRDVLVGDSRNLEDLLRRNLTVAQPGMRALIYHAETAIGAGVITGA